VGPGADTVGIELAFHLTSEGFASKLYYRWSKDFLEAGKKQLAGVDPKQPDVVG
jgi:hypothetical protein